MPWGYVNYCLYGAGEKMRLYGFLFRPKTAELWHPESPGMKVTVTRTWVGRLFKSPAFATFGETIKAGISKYDPVKSCEVYKESGCAHVDGFLCNMKKCTILSDRRAMAISKEGVE